MIIGYVPLWLIIIIALLAVIGIDVIFITLKRIVRLAIVELSRALIKNRNKNV
jgi:hypothetical protein